GRPDASREEIMAAAVAANADEFIQRLPARYDTVIGERGATLSGGEKQRLSIARAFLKDSPILILDEPTSAVDARTEVLLLDAMRRLMQGRITFVIAHRLSTIRHADQILVLDRGRIVERGRHENLLVRRGLYATLYDHQVGMTAHEVPAGAADLSMNEWAGIAKAVADNRRGGRASAKEPAAAKRASNGARKKAATARATAGKATSRAAPSRSRGHTGDGTS